MTERIRLPDLSDIDPDINNLKVVNIVKLFRETLKVLRLNRKLRQLSEQDVWCGNSFILSVAADADFIRFVHKVTYIDLRYEVSEDDLRYMIEENDLIMFGVHRN